MEKSEKFPARVLWLKTAQTSSPPEVSGRQAVGPTERARDKGARDKGINVVEGDLFPRFFDFDQMTETPDLYSTWRVRFGTQFVGGMNGTTEDLEYSILEPDGSGKIRGVGTFTGEINGLDGGFIFESTGLQGSDGTFSTNFKVKRKTAWGQLKGIRGVGNVIATRDHCGPDETPETCTTLVTFNFRYRLKKGGAK